MRAALTIAGKDLRQRVRDRSAFMLGIVAPLGLAFIFSLILPDFSGADFEIPAGVVDEDGSQLSSVFAENVLPSIADDGLLSLESFETAEAARAAVTDGDLNVAWIVESGFEAAVLAGDEARVVVVGNVDTPVSAEIGRSIAASFTADVSEGQLAGAAAAALSLGDPTPFVLATQTNAELLTLTDVSAASTELSGTTFFSAGMAVFFLFFTVQFGVSSLIEERTIGTMPRLLAAPIASMAIVAGKAIASFVVGLVSMLVLAAATTAFIGADWGDPLSVLVLMVFGVLAALGIMGVIATLAKSPEQAANWQSIVAVVLGLLGGSFFPLSQGPGLLANLSLLTPHAWFLRGLGDLSAGGGLGSIGGPIAALAAFSLVTMGLAALRVKRMVAP